jgi:hypothetical protein
MSARESFLPVQTNPELVAVDLLGYIQDIEKLLSGSTDNIRDIKNRGWWDRLTSSSQDDLVSLTSSQNKINALMLELIQDVITMNTMSYSFLAAVIAELEHRARNGWKDAEGKFQELSSVGRDFADKARSIFLKIAEGSKDTQRRIEMNHTMIGELQLKVAAKDELDADQDRDIYLLDEKVKVLQLQVDGLREDLQRQSASVAHLENTIRELRTGIEESDAERSGRLARIQLVLWGMAGLIFVGLGMIVLR